MPVHFEIIGKIDSIHTIAVGSSIRDIARLRRQYGAGRWGKLKGLTIIRLPDGMIRKAEIHWYEAHGIGRKKLQIEPLFGLIDL